MYIVRKPMQQDDRPAIGGAALFIRNPQNPRLDLLQHHGAPVDILLAKCSVPPTAVSWFMARDPHQNGHLADEIACLSQMRSEEHTSELQSLMRISYAVFCLKKKINNNKSFNTHTM